MTARVLKPDPKHMKGSTERYLLGQKHNLQIFGVIPQLSIAATKRRLNNRQTVKNDEL